VREQRVLLEGGGQPSPGSAWLQLSPKIISLTAVSFCWLGQLNFHFLTGLPAGTQARAHGSSAGSAGRRRRGLGAIRHRVLPRWDSGLLRWVTDAGPSRASAGPKLGAVVSPLPAALADPQRSATVTLQRPSLSLGLAVGPGLLCSRTIYPAIAQHRFRNKIPSGL